jgi:hypothetical protein
MVILVTSSVAVLLIHDLQVLQSLVRYLSSFLHASAYYSHLSMSLNLLGIKSVPLYTRSDQGFLPSIDECKKLITSKTRAITLVTPNNPVGFPLLPPFSQTYPAEPDWCNLLTRAHCAICRTSAREKYRTRSRRDVS